MSNTSAYKKEKTPFFAPTSGEKKYELYNLPNGLTIHHLNKHETDFVYNEVFEEKVYLKHGITINEGDCIFDIGANIGLFSLFLLEKFKNIKIHAFEPSPQLCEIIRLNTAGYDPRVILHQCGVSNENKEALFTFYPGYSILSGFNARLDQDKTLLKAGLGVLNPAKNQFNDLIIDEMVKEKLKQKIEYTCPLETISGIIRRHRLGSIDLLKIDAEKSELDILKGIDAADWPKIKQVVMEVHDAEGKLLNEITALLEGKGFNLQVEQEKNFKQSGIVNLYARQENAPLAAEPVKNREKFVIAATFTIDPLIPGIEFWSRELELPAAIEPAPYNQVFQELLSPQSLLRTNSSGMNIILVKFDDWLRYRQEPADESKNKKTLTRNRQQYMKTTFKEFMQALRTYSELSSSFTLLLVCPSSPAYAGDSSFSKLLDSFEKELESLIRSLSGLEWMKASAYHSYYRLDRQEDIFDTFSDELGHIPYKNRYYNFLSTLIMRRFYSLRRKPYKVLALDCDNTLWKGVCGEDGPGGVEIAGLFEKFQQFLIKKSNQGFLLCLSSKNVEEDVRDVFDKNERMVLKWNHIVAARINWQPKSVNIKGLAQTLNLGLDSFIFVDDNPVECADVRLNCPEVLTIQWPLADNNDSFLEHLWILDSFSITDEDKKRKDSYKANVDREKLRGQSYDFKSFIENLNLEITLTPVDASSVPRAAQLTQRTNQFNFTTIRRSQKQVEDLIAAGTHECWTARVKDRFGDYGIVGLMIAKQAKNLLELDTFLLSCRVLGRGVEYKMMAKLGEIARDQKKKQVKIVYKKTPKNEPARLFIQHFASGYIVDKDGEDLEILYPAKELAKVCYTPPRSEDDLPVKAGKKEKEKIPRESLNDFASVRKTERLVTRIALELSQPADLAREIHRFKEKSVETAAAPQGEIQPAPAISTSKKQEKELHRRVMEKVKGVFSASLSISRMELDPDTEIENYLQHDSLKIVEITSALNDEFTNIQPTLLFEHRTLKSITENIVANSREALNSVQFKTGTGEQGLDSVGKTGVNRTPARELAGLKKEPQDKDIAIIGMNGRFPQAATPREFWENLKAGISSITKVPTSRWDIDVFFDEEGKPGKSYCQWGGFIDDIDGFEASFFHISPREAETMDPQQRIFMEVVWGLLEDAGYTPQTLGRDTGVFVGVIASDYNIYANEATLQGEAAYRNSDYYQIPNRISYFFDFKGPSIAVDTACSSAGTALHLACQSLRQKECRAAVVGGLNLFLHPGRFIQYSQIRVLSRDDKCRPFGDGASGTLYGEGIGAILIKPLKAAEKDGDHIYAVIKGSAINSGGKTNGFTVPNPLAQADLISRALEDASVDAGTISYIEAHGTGTPLGDPIEIRGLTKAFRENGSSKNHKADTRYCAVGSVKSNIGHLESGAAIAGIIKILLQMKHGKLTPSLNALPLNPMISFEKTPFYVQQTYDDWKPPQIKENGKSVRYPRRAGISSFGAGGVNTHFILEEYQKERPDRQPAADLSIIVFSAGNEEKLKVYLSNMIEFLQIEPGADGNGKRPFTLEQIAYSLQLGREPMSERLAVISSSLEELKEKLVRYCRGEWPLENVYRGNANKDQARIRGLIEGRTGEEFVKVILENGDIDKLARLWVLGNHINWELLYPGEKPRRISLPTYPFAGKKYWLAKPGMIKVYKDNPGKKQEPRLHPMITANVSTLKEEKFYLRLTGEEFFIKDHVIRGTMMLPGVSYIEMARAAGQIAGEARVSEIRDIVWSRPIVLEKEPYDVFIGLYPHTDGTGAEFAVYTESKESEQIQRHAQGKVLYETGVSAASDHSPAADSINIEAIQKRCPHFLTGEDCYRLFSSAGIEYGPGLRPVRQAWCNQWEALALLQLPPGLSTGFSDYRMHPSLMDGALQTVQLLMANRESAFASTYLPFALGTVEQPGPLTAECYARVTLSDKMPGDKSQVKKINLQLVDNQGQTLVKMTDLAIRVMPSFRSFPGSAGHQAPTMMYYRDSRVESFPQPQKKNRMNILIFAADSQLAEAIKDRWQDAAAGGENDHRVIMVKPGQEFKAPADNGDDTYEIQPESGGDYCHLVEHLHRRGLLSRLTIIHGWSGGSFTREEKVLGEQLKMGVYSVFYLSQALMSLKLQEALRLLLVYSRCDAEPRPQHAALAGIAKTIPRENSKILCKTVEMRLPPGNDPGKNVSQLADFLMSELNREEKWESEVLYHQGKRWVRQLQPLDMERDPQNPAAPGVKLKQQGVYLITGGFGSLGLIFARFLAKEAAAQLVLTDCCELDTTKKEEIRTLESIAAGVRVCYLKADITRAEEVKQLIAAVRSKFAGLNGIIHCAGIIRDALILKKTAAQMESVLAPKVFGTIYLDEATRDIPLDFFVLFSSITAVVGNRGQSDYAYANSFLDHFAAWREWLKTNGKRRGKTLSINWSLWQEGGMKVDKPTEKMLESLMGINPLPTEKGLDTFLKGLASGQHHFTAVYGNPGQWEKFLETTPPENKTPKADRHHLTTASIQPRQEERRASVQAGVAKILEKILKIDQKDIDFDEEISVYGFDSITTTDFINRINETYHLEFSPAQFFEYPTLGAFVRHLDRHHGQDVLRHYPGEPGTSTGEVENDTNPSPGEKEKVKPRFQSIASLAPHPPASCEAEKEPIAIIGMSGRFPQSGDLEIFWKNLEQGKDLVREIPPDRWDWRDYYGDPGEEGNKTDIKWGGFIEDVDKFDASFFGISPREAELMDPQQRIFLETVWNTIEDAGYKPSSLSGTKTGMFVGVSINDYNEILKDYEVDIEAHLSSGINNSIVSNRISYLLNLRGPSESMDTACSSSLVAIRRGVDCIRSGECELAVAGGVNVILRPKYHISFRKAGMLSGDGKCKVFDKRADGYVRSEGAGAVLLKPLSRARADGDHIYAVIRGTAENHGGRAHSLTAPNPNAQAEVISQAWKNAQIDPATVTYIEAHGTGTELGDPIEINGLKKTVKKLYEDTGQTMPMNWKCGIGSVKTNIGHLECAAGIAGVIKVLLAMKHKTLPASIHFKELNPQIQLDDSPFYITRKTMPWERLIDEHGNEIPRRAGVSGFGFGGTNAHILLEEYESSSSHPLLPDVGPYIIPLSAKNEERLKVYAGNMALYLEKAGPALALSHLAYTLQVGREHLEERLAVTAANLEELKEKLQGYCRCRLDIKGLFKGNIKTVKEKTGLLPDEKPGKEPDPNELAQLWVSGAELDWKSLYLDKSPQRISLPGYPFAREVYWVPKPAHREEIIGKNPADQPGEEPGIMYYHPCWEEARPGVTGGKPAETGNFIIFDTDEQMFQTLRERLAKHQPNGKAVLVKPGKSWKTRGDSYEIDPGNPDHYRRLLEHLGGRGLVRGTIIHGWSRGLCPEKGEGVHHGDKFLKERLQVGIYSLFHLTRALMEQKPRGRVKLKYVYFTPGAETQPLYAAINGFARTVGLENPDFLYKTVEVRNSAGMRPIPPAEVLDRLILEPGPRDGREVEVRFHGDRRLVRRIKEINSPGDRDKPNPLPWKENGVYIITGGMGGLGMICAGYLAKKNKIKLVLTGRSDLNPGKETRIKELGASGSEVIYIKADISRRPEVERLIKEARARFTRINGIIHCAGEIHDSFILKKTPLELDAVLAPKVYGTIYLDEATRKEDLDFFVMFSSLSAITGNIGQCDYAYANSFMDNFARQREQLREQGKRSGRTISINWPLWQEGGMQIPEDQREGFFQQTGLEALPTPEGMNALEFALQTDACQCIVTYGRQSRIKQALNQGLALRENFETLDMETGGTPDTIEPKLLFEKTEAFLKKVFQRIIKLPLHKIDAETRFEEYGIDSIMINMFNAKIGKEWGKIPKTLLFEYQTLHQLTGYFVKNHPLRLAAFFGLTPGPTAGKSAGESREPGQYWQRREVTSPGPGNKEEEPIAVIGMAGRYPMAKNLEEFWENLKCGKDCVIEIPAHRWNYREYYHPDPGKGKIYCKWGGFIDDADKFDSLLFNISPREAKTMDPQERLFLETVWETLEDAGYSGKALKRFSGEEEGGGIGVFSGVTTFTYSLLDLAAEGGVSLPLSWSIANRVSFVFDFQGPSMPVDTACSSSLTAIHLACESLKKGECQMAIAGGVNLCLHPRKYRDMCAIKMLSPTGRCRTFGSGADGFVPGEGVGAILLKPLSRAIGDHDHIYAVIKASSINHGGRTNGYTVPNPNAQANLISGTMAAAGIDPLSIGYIEAHGTGTSLGDPIEVAGLTKAYGKYTPHKHYCAIGSVKSNIGHLESAAGISGLTKILLQMKHKQLVPSLHAEKLNPNIDFENSPFYVQKDLHQWPNPVISEKGTGIKYPRRAAISSFGAGGSNAHLIVEEYEPEEPHHLSETSNQLIILSARNEERLKTYAARLADFLGKVALPPRRDRKEDELSDDEIQKQLREMAAGILHMQPDDMDGEEDFTLAGFDPVTLAILTRRINEQFHLEILPPVLSEYPSINTLAQYLGGLKPGSQPPTGVFPPSLSLADIAYTLQVGRDPMAGRIAFVINDINELKEKLLRYSRGKTDIEGLFEGDVHRDKKLVEGLFKGKAGEEHVKALMEEQNLEVLAQLWVSGFDIDWHLWYPREKPHRVSLPTYPFARETHWIKPQAGPAFQYEDKRCLHPLIDGIHPALSLDVVNGLVFQKTLRQTDLIVKHHQVAGQCILPAVGYLEMAYAAVSHLHEYEREQEQGHDRVNFNLNGILLMQPLVVQDRLKEVRIVVKKNNEKLQLEIHSKNDNHTVTHARGESHLNRNHPPVNRRISIDEIKSRCSGQIDKEMLYASYRQIGLHYGEYFQGLDCILMNDEEALGILNLPGQYETGFHRDNYTLHPTLMDAALQTTTGLEADFPKGEIPPLLPFFIEKVEVFQPLGKKGYSYVRTVSKQHHKYNVTVLDDTGMECIKLHGVTLRELKSKHTPAKAIKSQDPLEHFFYKPRWILSPSAPKAETRENEPEKRKILVIYPFRFKDLVTTLTAAPSHGGDDVTHIQLGNKTKQHAKNLLEIDTGDISALDNCIAQIERIDYIYFFGGAGNEIKNITDPDALEESQEQGVISLFRLVKTLIRHGFNRKPVQFKVITGDTQQVFPDEVPAFYQASLYGLSRSMVKEYSQWKSVCIDIGLKEITPGAAPHKAGKLREAADAILLEPTYESGKEVAFRSGKRYERILEPIILPPVDKEQTLLRPRGVYLILGGTGGIGFELSRFLVETVKARLVLVDRSPLNAVQKEKIAQIEAIGGEVLYVQADGTSPESMKTVVQQAKTRFGKINGAIHSAIVLRDKILENMDEETFRAALAPKTRGSVILYEILREEPLDFMMFFSSAQSFACNPGQSNYAAGCTFKDAFAHYLNQVVSYPVKIINWGYWGTVGVVASREYNQRLAQQGVWPIKPAEGMEAVKRVLAYPLHQISPLKVEDHVLEAIGTLKDRHLELYPENIPSLAEPAPDYFQSTGQAQRDKEEIDRLVQFMRGLDELEQLSPLMLLKAFREMGVWQNPGEEHHKEKLREQLKIIPRCHLLFDALLEILVRAELIETRDQQLFVSRKPGQNQLNKTLANLEKSRERFIKNNPRLTPHIKLLSACVTALPGVLTGEVNHMDVMFPKGSMELVENIYRGNALSDFYNKEVARFLEIYTRERLNRDPDTPVQIMEVGAGTGGTSAFVLAALKEYEDRVRFIYTDVSLKFILHGKDTFASGYPFARFTVFDIEKPPEEQDFEPNSIDLIFASNVLHATRNLDNTVNRLKGLLKTNGLLIINEVTRPGNFHSLTFGLTDGWWLFEDSANRIKGSPLVTGDNWQDLLKINGFRHVNIPQGPGEIDHEPWQSIIIGESNGQVIKERKKSAPQQVESLTPIPSVSLPVIKKQEKSQPESAAESPKNDELPDSPGEDLEEVIIGILSQILHIDKTEFAPDLSFQDYGVDSLLAVEIIDKLCEELNVSLRATDLFNFPTIRSLTNHIVKDPGYNPAPRRAGPVQADPVRQEKTNNNHNRDIDTAEESIETVLIGNMEREEENGIIDDGTLLDLLQRLEVGELSSDEVDRLLEVGGL